MCLRPKEKGLEQGITASLQGIWKRVSRRLGKRPSSSLGTTRDHKKSLARRRRTPSGSTLLCTRGWGGMLTFDKGKVGNTRLPGKERMDTPWDPCAASTLVWKAGGPQPWSSMIGCRSQVLEIKPSSDSLESELNLTVFSGWNRCRQQSEGNYINT